MIPLPARPALVPRERLGRVRPFDLADLPGIVQLYERVVGRVDAVHALERYLADILWSHPWDRDVYPSLVYESGGRIVGCLGVMPRRMVFRGRPIVMAVGHHFMVDPARRTTAAGLELMRRFLAGPQQLSLAEGNDSSRKLWEGARGSTSLLYSLRWVRPLRPARYLVSTLGRKGFSRTAAMLGPLACAVDAVTTRAFGRALGASGDRLSEAELDDKTLANGIREFSDGSSLRPDYDERGVDWLMARLASKPSYGSLQRKAVCNAEGELVGWYLYYLRRGATSEVVQLAGRRRWLGDVLEHLLSDARAGGAAAVSGRLDPHLIPACVARQCFYRAGGSWTLVDSHDRDILGAIHQGDAFLTRLEGQWWLGYGGDAARRH